MYCNNCGREIANHSKYCMHCGAQQNTASGGKKKKSSGNTLWMAAIILLAFVSIQTLGGQEKEDNVTISQKPGLVLQPRIKDTQDPVRLTPEPTDEVPAQKPSNGWYEENGKKYYLKDGVMLTGMQEIDNELYYFYDDGVMAVNEDIDLEGVILEIGSDGRADGLILEYISGEWSSDKYHFGNNGTSSILDLEIEVENCDYMTLYLEAEGQYGASVNGNWKFYVRSHGSWVLAKEFSYEEPSGSIKIRFDKPMDFDAITAYPTRQGNASYSSGYILCDVHITF